MENVSALLTKKLRPVLLLLIKDRFLECRAHTGLDEGSFTSGRWSCAGRLQLAANVECRPEP